MKIFRNNKTESVVSDQLSQLNDREQYFLGLMKKVDTAKRPIEELLALSYITQYKNSYISKNQQQRTLAKLHELLDSSENDELKKLQGML